MKKAKAGAKIVHCEGNYKKEQTDMKLRHRSSKKKVSERSEISKKLTKKQEEMITPTTAQQ